MSARQRPTSVPRAATKVGNRPSRGRALPPADFLVVGNTPVLARVAGALLALAAVCRLAALFPAYLVVGGERISLAAGVLGVLAVLVVAVPSLLVGLLLAAGRLPKLGLAFAGVTAPLAAGNLLIELYRGSDSTVRAGREVLAGHWLVTSGVERAPGWWLLVGALALTVLAGGCALAAWGRTVMDDGGSLDPVRPALGGLALALGILGVLCLALPPVALPQLEVPGGDYRVLGQVELVEQQGPQALLERPGWALLGGFLLAGAVVLGCVLAPSLRPRLAAVGGLAGLASVVLGEGLAGARDAVTSPDLDWTLPGAGLLVAGLGFAVLTVLAWRLRRGRQPGG